MSLDGNAKEHLNKDRKVYYCNSKALHYSWILEFDVEVYASVLHIYILPPHPLLSYTSTLSLFWCFGHKKRYCSFYNAKCRIRQPDTNSSLYFRSIYQQSFHSMFLCEHSKLWTRYQWKTQMPCQWSNLLNIQICGRIVVIQKWNYSELIKCLLTI